MDYGVHKRTFYVDVHSFHMPHTCMYYLHFDGSMKRPAISFRICCTCCQTTMEIEQQGVSCVLII